MRTDWNWPGSRWWIVDLHAHSPASDDYRPQSERSSRDWSQWIAAAAAAGLDAVAVTDHNTPDGIQGIQAAAAALAGQPIVFPGVELTVGGIHLLCIFDPSCSRDEVVSLLGQVGVQPDQYGRTDTISTEGVLRAIEITARCGGVVIAAHINGPKGLLIELNGEIRKQSLIADGLSAVELAPVIVGSGMMAPSIPETVRWVDGSMTGRRLGVVSGSDSHTRTDAGCRYTWMKMTRPDASGLRLALLDGEASLLPVLRGDVRDPNEHAPQIIESIAVTNAKYIGRPLPFLVPLNPWLNTIIGGRGTGKSTLIDMLRLVLCRESELNDSGDTSLRAAFNNRMRVPPARMDEGLLTSETCIEIIFRKDGERYAITLDTAESSSTVVRLDGADRFPEEGSIPERFPVRIYGQKQLFDLAKAPDALLSVIDDTDAVRGAELQRSRAEAEAQFLSLMAEVRALRSDAADLGRRRVALSDLQRKISLLEQRGNADVLSEYRLREEQREAWAQTHVATEELFRLVMQAAAAELPAIVDGPSETDPASVAFGNAIAETRRVVEEFAAAIVATTERARESLTEAEAAPDFTSWRVSVDAAEANYHNLSNELAEAGIPDPDAYADLILRRTTAAAEIRALEDRLVVASERESAANDALARCRRLRAELTMRRGQFAGRTSTDMTHVEIRGLVDSAGLDSFLRETLGIEHFDEDHRQLAERIRSRDDEGVPWAYDRLDTLVADLRAFVADPQSRWQGASDRRIEAALRRVMPERLDRLALFSPADTVEVSFCDPRGDPTHWQRLATGSPGQQTAALLAFVLGYGHEPIILDQPEDDLDNTLIYDLLVKKLRASKQGRQIIVVTHNPNIVVHGDAELVISLEARAGQTHICCLGGLQEVEVRDEVCRVMEGGSDAFDLRYRRIRHPGWRLPMGPAFRGGAASPDVEASIQEMPEGTA